MGRRTIYSARLGAIAFLGLSGAALPASAQDTMSLGNIAVSDVSGDIVLDIGASARPNCADFTLAEPPTLVVSCVGMTMGASQPVQQVGNGVIDRIEISESSDADGTNTQIRVLLTKVLEYDKVVSDSSVRITLRTGQGGGDAIGAAVVAATPTDASGGPAPNLRLPNTRTGQLSSVDGDHAYDGSGVQVRGVDFQNLAGDGVSRIVVSGSAPLRYTASYPSDKQVVLAFHDAALGTGLERRLDTSKFASAVSSVASFRSRTTAGDVKVVVDLREAVRPRFTEQGAVLLVDFPIPASVAGAAYQAPSTQAAYEEPAEPEVADEDRIENAVGRERLIAGGGETIDPARKARKKQGSIFGSDAIFMGEIDPNHQWKGFPINLDLVNANIHNVFRLISHVSKLNIVSSDDVKGTVTVRLVEVPWDQALAAILQSKSLGAVQYGSILRVASIATLRNEKEDAAEAEDARLDSMQLNILALPLNYAQAEEIEKQLEGMLSRRGSVNFDPRTNTLVIRDIDESLSRIRELVRALDARTPQVLIEARIVEASASFTRALGIQWGGNLNFSPATGMPLGLFFPNSFGASGGSTASTVAPGVQSVGGRTTNFTTVPNYVVDLPAQNQASSLGVSLGSVTGAINLDARLSAGESAGTGKVISAPSVTALTNETAFIRDGARIPYQTASLRGTNVQFVEATLQLSVTPQVTADGTIFLAVAIQKNQPDFGTAVGGLPTIQIKEAETTLMVADGDTTVIGGVYSFEEQFNKEFVPGLGKIPVLGWLFKATQKRVTRKELLVFLTPTIIRGRR